MAITSADVAMWQALKAMGALPLWPLILEIGEANWYGDVPAPGGEKCPWKAAKAFYRSIFGEGMALAIDLHGGDTAIKVDLNEPVGDDTFGTRRIGDPVARFDIVINTGTTEHIFNQCQVFTTIHNFCKPGGLMVHSVPHDGPEWLDHGFYCYQPTFFRDLAKANAYDVLYQRVAPFFGSTMLCVALRKTKSDGFKIPQQGRYA